MIKKLLLLALMTSIFNSPGWSWDKSKFDIDVPKETLALKKAGGIGYEGQVIKKTVSEVTLIQGGYFTLGTNQGLSPTALDDHCGITFGHPYALTSYPVISIDGLWGKVDDFFDIYASLPIVEGDSLSITYVSSNFIQLDFSMKPDNSGETITMTTTIKNLDIQSHVFGMGLVFDPGLGKKGDGWVHLGNQDVLQDTMLTGAGIPTQFVIKERIGTADGMKLLTDFGASVPDQLILANWKDIYQNHGANFSYSETRKLYDLAIKALWAGQAIPAGGEMSKQVVLRLLPPDFNSPLFMRWDLPGFLSIENNLLFPRSFDSFVDIANWSQSYNYNAELKFIFPDELFAGTTSYPVNISANQVLYQKIKMQSKESYEDKIVDVTIRLESNGLLLDSILKQVYIPAIPVSDTGLVCTIDTVMTSEYPNIKFTFEAQVEVTGQKLFNLMSENVFLYENDTRIKQFLIGKDTTGGVTMSDIIFVLDVTGSMSNEIVQVKNNIIEFSDSLDARGVDFRLGMVTFLDVIENVYNLTNDPQLFKSYVAAQNAHGGGDSPENSLDALYRATQFPFRENANRIFIWITDNSFHERDIVTSRSREEVVNQLLLHDIVVHAIGATQFQTNWYNSIIEPTGGNFYNIFGNFRDILLDISRIKTSSRYLVTYTSPGAISGVNQITLELHYAGLGGTGYAEYNFGGVDNPLRKAIDCYPNPFNPIIQISVNLPEFSEATLEIFNILGQRVRSFPLKGTNQRHVISWDAKDNWNRNVGMGTYFVRLNVFGNDGKLQRNETTKILYLK